MIAWLRKLLAPDVPIIAPPAVKSDFEVLIECMKTSAQLHHEQVTALFAILDRIVTARYDRPVIADSKPNVLEPALPKHTLSDVLDLDDDESFIAKSQELIS